MQLLNQIEISRTGHEPALIQLLQGDLSAIPAEHKTDILILSAYPGSYVPVPKTLIAALDNKGLSIEALAKNKEFDLRDQLGCWLSHPLDKEQQEQFNFKRVLCFEPWQQTNEQVSIVGNIFRCINTFAFAENNNVIAMPVLASGKQKVPFEKMLPALLDASIFWLENGLPLKCIKLVLFSDEQAGVALPVFTRAKQQNEIKQSVREGTMTGAEGLKMLEIKMQQQLPGEESLQMVDAEIKEMAQKEKDQPIAQTQVPGTENIAARPAAPPASPAAISPPPSMPGSESLKQAGGATAKAPESPAPLTATGTGNQYDYFVSYAHKHAQLIDAFVSNLTAANNKLQIFYDKSSIPAGGLWIKQISDALQKTKKVLIFLSPEYSNSPVCWDEFQCAKLMEYNTKKQLIQTIYLFNDTAMPPIMGIYSYTDCREGDKDKLQQMVSTLIEELASPAG